MLGLVLPVFAQYAGPAILSRGEAPAAMTAPTVDFAFSVALTGIYTSGLVGVSAPDAQGNLRNRSAFGGGVTLGASGAHSWRHTHVGLNYSGSFFDYLHASYFAGLRQGLSLGITHQITRHVALSLRESAGIFTQFPPATVSLNSTVPFDPSQSDIPTTDFYNNRTIYTTTQADLIYQVSTRLSFSAGGAFFKDTHSSSALYGATGESATGDVQYRLSRRATIGAAYSYAHYSYTNAIGGANIHAPVATAAVRMSQWSELSVYGGVSRVSSSFQQTVPIDPAILAILCPPTLVTACPLNGGTVNVNRVILGPNFGARLSRSFHRGVAYASVGESITPGNGLFLTSRMVKATVGYGYSGLRKWNIDVGASYMTALSFGNVQGGYSQISGSYGMSRQLVKSLSFVSSFSASQYRSGSFSAYNRLVYTASLGLGFSSKNIPLRFF
jgi:hypothetical protein